MKANVGHSETSTQRKRTSARPSMRERVYLHLRARIRKGEIGHEDRMVDHEIAADLSVSRMPVREALLQLKSEGLVEGTSRGFVLRRFTPADITQMFEVRLLLEPPAAAAACMNASLDGLAKMQKAIGMSDQADRDGNILAYIKAVGLFREAWINMVPNTYLAAMITRLDDHVEAVRVATLRNPQFREWSLTTNKRTMEAFLDKAIGKVEETVRDNLRRAATSYYATQDELLESQGLVSG